MLFQTWPFLAFFLAFYAVYLPLRRTRFWLHWTLAASYVFYGVWNPLYLALILYSTLVDYFVAARMERAYRKRLWLAASIANNLLVLGFFKYARFLTDSINWLLARAGAGYGLHDPDFYAERFTQWVNWALALAGVDYVMPRLEFLLPVGISFYTFLSMNYAIDCYRGAVERERSLVRYAAYVSFFPQLLAGPISRAKALLPQLRRLPPIGLEGVTDGLSLFVVGLFKKAALADYLTSYVDPIYAAPDLYGAPALMLATVAFAWQIYFDFSGYTDMARGVARLMGVRLMLNFNNPYLAVSLGDFWTRWHISLSSWFRDYFYIPLGGNRAGAWRTYRNVMLTMLVSGLWHGAAWTFVIWGAVHGAAALLTREAERSRWYRERVPKLAKQIFVFGVVCFAWIFFRADSAGDAWLIVSRIFRGGWSDPAFPLLAACLVGLIWAYQFVYESRARRLLQLSSVRVWLVTLMILYLAMAPGAGGKPFIYLKF